VLKPGGRLVIADFKRPENHQDQPVRFGAGASDLEDLRALIEGAGLALMESEAMPLPRVPVLPGLHALPGPEAGFVRARKP
jgi:hypothetical protein